MKVKGKDYRTVWMDKDFVVHMINQPKLPHEFEIASYDNYKDTADSITDMVVRGAGALGVAGGFAAAQAVKSASKSRFIRDMGERIQVTAIATGFGCSFDTGRGRTSKELGTPAVKPKADDLDIPTILRNQAQEKPRATMRLGGYSEDEDYDIPAFLRKRVD